MFNIDLSFLNSKDSPSKLIHSLIHFKSLFVLSFLLSIAIIHNHIPYMHYMPYAFIYGFYMNMHMHNIHGMNKIESNQIPYKAV